MLCVTLPIHCKKYDQDETGLYKSLWMVFALYIIGPLFAYLIPEQLVNCVFILDNDIILYFLCANHSQPVTVHHTRKQGKKREW